MKKIFSFFIALAAALTSFATDRVSSLPCPILGGELSNSATTSVADIDEVMPRMRALGLNTVLVPAIYMWYSFGLACGRIRCRAIRQHGSSRTRSVSHER